MPLSGSGGNTLATVAPGDTYYGLGGHVALDYYLRFPTPPLNSTSDAPCARFAKAAGLVPCCTPYFSAHLPAVPLFIFFAHLFCFTLIYFFAHLFCTLLF